MINIGGFFASLKLVTDENSFRQGLSTLEKFPVNLKGVAIGAAGVAAGMVALATTTASAMTKLDAQARTLGMTARTLDNWRGAVSLAGGDADAFVGSISSMNEAFRNLKIGEVKTDFIQATGMSGANFAAMQNMSNDDRVRTIWAALDRVTDAQKQQALREKIFGSGGVQLASLLQSKGLTLSQVYNQASSLNPKTDADYKSAIEGDRRQREISLSLENSFQNLGLKIEQAILPALDKLANWFATHQKELDGFAEAVGKATSGFISFFGWMLNSDQKQQTSQGLSWMLGGPQFGKEYEALAKAKGIDLSPGSQDARGTFLVMSQEWSKIADSIRAGKGGEDISSGFLSKFSGEGVSSSSQRAFQGFADALRKSGAGIADQYLQESTIARGVDRNPGMNLTLVYDASGNAKLVNKDTGKTLAEVKNGIATANAVSGLR